MLSCAVGPWDLITTALLFMLIRPLGRLGTLVARLCLVPGVMADSAICHSRSAPVWPPGLQSPKYQELSP